MFKSLFKITRCSKYILVLSAMWLVISLNACSNNTSKKTNTIQTQNDQQLFEQGTVLAVRTIQIRSDNNYSETRPYGNIGISASSGGFSGIYGSIDLASLGRLFKNNENKITQEIVVKKDSGETVVIIQATQAIKGKFKQGDLANIIVRNGKAEVIH